MAKGEQGEGAGVRAPQLSEPQGGTGPGHARVPCRTSRGRQRLCSRLPRRAPRAYQCPGAGQVRSQEAFRLRPLTPPRPPTNKTCPALYPTPCVGVLAGTLCVPWVAFGRGEVAEHRNERGWQRGGDRRGVSFSDEAMVSGPFLYLAPE